MLLSHTLQLSGHSQRAFCKVDPFLLLRHWLHTKSLPIYYLLFSLSTNLLSILMLNKVIPGEFFTVFAFSDKHPKDVQPHWYKIINPYIFEAATGECVSVLNQIQDLFSCRLANRLNVSVLVWILHVTLMHLTARKKYPWHFFLLIIPSRDVLPHHCHYWVGMYEIIGQ